MKRSPPPMKLLRWLGLLLLALLATAAGAQPLVLRDDRGTEHRFDFRKKKKSDPGPLPPPGDHA
jgi:hypothetical protein